MPKSPEGGKESQSFISLIGSKTSPESRTIIAELVNQIQPITDGLLNCLNGRQESKTEKPQIKTSDNINTRML